MSLDEPRQHLVHGESRFSWSNGIRGIPSGSGSGAGSFTDGGMAKGEV
jgi:hypothetical protein